MINCYPVLHIKKQYSCFIAETRNRETRAHLESWRTQAYYTDRPRDVNTSSSELRTKGLEFLQTDCSGQHQLLIGWFKLRGFVVATHSGKQTHSEGQCRQWSAVYYTGRPKAESPLSQGPQPVFVKTLCTLSVRAQTHLPKFPESSLNKGKERYNQS